MSAAGRTRPRTVGELLDLAFGLYARNLSTLVGLAALVVVPLELLVSIALISTYRSGSDIPGVGATGLHSHTATGAAALLGAQAILLVGQVLGSSLVTAASVKAVSDAHEGQAAHVEGSLGFALRRLPALIALEIIAGIGLSLAFLALIVPGVFLYCRWSVSTPVLLLEHSRPLRALRRSGELVRGRWWPTAAVLSVSIVIVGLIGIVFQIILVSGLSAHPSIVAAVSITCLSGAIGAILGNPFRASITTTLYHDLRARHDRASGSGRAGEGAGDDCGSDSGEGGGDDGWPEDPPRLGPDSVGTPGGPPFWPPPPGWHPGG